LPWLEKAVPAAPERPAVLVALGLARLGLGQTETALAPLRDAARRTTPRPARPRQRPFSLGRSAEAEPHLARALEVRPQSAAAHNDYAYAPDELGRSAAAAAHYRWALALRPMHPSNHYN
ncbi:MAG: hypothetical protein NTV51_10780, partial [Verrucomicrobia bacterium]|nr:hypothetical protein [Verrucomicrobiota bacterium]